MSSKSPVFVKKTPFYLLSLLFIVPLTCLSALLTIVHIIQSLISNYKSLLNHLKARVNPVDKAVFVTAGETELGFSCSQKLANMGYTVFVAYKDSCFRSRLLDLGQNVRPIQCDIIKYRDVTDAAHQISRQCLSSGRRLWSVVCIGSFCTDHFMHEETSHETYEEIIKINALGSARLAKAFLPLLKTSPGKTRSRLIFVSNISASMNLPSSICYAMSRAAESQFGYTLRKELKKNFQILTSFFEPVSFCSARQDSLTPHPSLPSSPTSWQSNSSPFAPEPGHPSIWTRIRDLFSLFHHPDHTDTIASELVQVVTQIRDPPFFISHQN